MLLGTWPLVRDAGPQRIQSPKHFIQAYTLDTNDYLLTTNRKYLGKYVPSIRLSGTESDYRNLGMKAMSSWKNWCTNLKKSMDYVAQMRKYVKGLKNCKALYKPKVAFLTLSFCPYSIQGANFGSTKQSFPNREADKRNLIN